MNAKADYQHDPADGGALRFTGSLSLATLGNLPDRLDREDAAVRRIDLSQVDRIDTVGAADPSLRRAQRRRDRRSG